MKYLKQNQLKLIFCGFALIILLFALHIYNNENIGNEEKGFYLSIVIASIGFIAGLILTVLENIYCSIKKNIDISCKHQMDLHDLGILNTYRHKDDNYFSHLLEDFNNLNKNHMTKDNPIKMIGVSLHSYFLTSGIYDIMKQECNEYFFRILICTKENPELKSRFDFVKDIRSDKNAENKNTFENSGIYGEINRSTNRIEELMRIYNKEETHVHCCRYYFSPFATIIIINDHIYYTPNMLEYEDYNIDTPDEKQKNTTELSFRIRRKSGYGKRLEKLFDSYWKSEISQEHELKYENADYIENPADNISLGQKKRKWWLFK
ncbi:MAG: hypothetical protein FWD47_13790 [Treponema sp.]|nr:hypothetical protein [Treponema sp.]